MKILIAGGTGFIGKALSFFLVGKKYEVNVLTRRKIRDTGDVHYYQWDVEKGFIDPHAFDGVNAIINMTGANIGEKRWTTVRKQEIIDSRLKPLNLLLRYVKESGHRIDVLISSSAVGYYGAVTTERIFTEEDKNGTDFPAHVCKLWEDTARKFDKVARRVVILRKGVVIGRSGGMYRKLQPLAKLGINVALGSGRQYLPWICIGDLVRIYSYVLENKKMNGVFNAVTSEHITMNDFSKKMLHSFGKMNILPNVPSWVIRARFGEMSEMLLRGSRVSNEKIKSMGFGFWYQSIHQCL
jgi:uncharacterized protein (TIGR01777 family)